MTWTLEQNKHNRKKTRIGYHGPSNWMGFPSFCLHFMMKYPDIQISINIMEMDELKHSLEAETIDVAIMMNPEFYGITNIMYKILFSELGCLGMNNT